MKNKNFLKKVSTIALSGAVFAVSLLSFGSVAANSTVAAGAKLEVVNQVDKDNADRGETLSYTIKLNNAGDAELTNVKFWINPLNLSSLISGSATYTRSATGVTKALEDNFTTVTNNFGTVPAGENVTIKFKTKVADNANMDNIIWLIGNAKSDQTPSTVTSNSWTRVILKNPGLCAEKTADKKVVEKGDVVTFTIKACNKGNIVLHNVMITDIIQAPFKYVEGSTESKIEGQVAKVDDSWLQYGVKVPYLNPGQEVFVTFKVTVGSDFTNGQTLQNVAQVHSDETPNIIKCPVYLTGKVLGVTKPPKELPNTGPGEVMLLISGLVPAGYFLKRFKSKI